ncbi:MAG: hypothetical protein ACLPN1_19000 [Dissulfurispiraceae bacterium]|jgi:hypothetical protein
MKRILIVVVVAVIAVLLAYTLPQIQKSRALSGGKTIKVLLVYNPEYTRGHSAVLAAYESVLQEEGVPFESLDVFQLSTLNAADLAKTVPVMILPDGILMHVPPQFGEWTKKYLSKGGNVAVIYDAGTRQQKGYYLERAAFADVLSLNYITFITVGTRAFEHAHIRFSSKEDRDFFQFPSGKTIDGVTISGYRYGALEYPVARNEPGRDLPAKDIYAYGVTAKGEKFPAIVLTDFAAGKVLYVNLPLGALKANSDDLPLRAILRTFLFDVVRIPHLINTEAGRGGITIDWHVDSAVEHKTLPLMLETGLLRKDIKASIDITAGDFLNKPGDGLGFDACGKGRPLAETLKEYGTIGSHGGWGHNWFAKNIEDGTFTEKEIRENIEKNNRCLETITGYKITEYAAPVGVHPQPVTTQILEDLGIIAYYYTGDTGSGPNRTFYQNKMVSDRVVAFPVMPLGRSASLYEMAVMDKRKNSEVMEWLFDILSYTARNRTVRLFYSHPYNINLYPQAIKAFMDRVEKMQREGEISVRSMSDFARFFLRFLKTKYDMSEADNGLLVSLANPEGLAGITVAVPKAHYSMPSEKGYSITEDGRFFYVTITGNETKCSFLCSRR